MVRLAIGLCFTLFSVNVVDAAAEDDPRISRALALQKAMNQAKEHLAGSRPAEAAAVLEEQILRVDGDERYLTLMRQVYVEYWKDLKARGDSPARLDHVRRQLRILDPKLNPDEIEIAVVSPAPTATEEGRPIRKAAGQPLARGQSDDDPFQQVPLDRLPPGAQRPRPNPQPRPAENLPDGWQAVDTANFRILFRQSRPRAEQLAKLAEQARQSAFDKWAGPAGGNWSARCELWLHANGEEYAAATRQPASSPGHSSVGLREGRVENRRIDLRLDVAGFEESALPREVTYVVLTDLFPDQPLPSWAQIGMTALSEAPAHLARCRRAVAGLLSSKSLPAAKDLLPKADFPDPAKITPFYVASVTLVEFLVQLKGPKAFALYLREAPRRGYLEALERHYGIRDAADLQDRWLKFATQGQ